MKLPAVPGRTTPGFAFSFVDRALKDCLSERKFTQYEIKQVVTFFYGDGAVECIFCGNKNVSRWDHLVPVTKGGDTVLGNMVLACAKCDDSKRDLSFDEWMLSNNPWSPKSLGISDIDSRIEKIREYINFYNYCPCQLEDKLDLSEAERLEAIRLRLREVRNEVDILIQDHRERTGKR